MNRSIYLNSRPGPGSDPARNACHQPGVNDMNHDTRQPPTTPDPNLVLFLRALVLLALIAACVYGGLSEAILALMLRHLP